MNARASGPGLGDSSDAIKVNWIRKRLFIEVSTCRSSLDVL